MQSNQESNRHFDADLSPEFTSLRLGESSELQRTSETCPVLTLPPEIVSEIFLNFLPAYPECPPNFGIYSPLLLCRICRQWRAIAISTLELWRAIQIEVSKNDSDEKLAALLELLQTWLSRSGDYSLSLSLRERSPKSPLSPQFLQAALLHCHRWEYVEIWVDCKHLYLTQGEMPLLRDLNFGPIKFRRDFQPHALLFDDAPQLKRITLPLRFSLNSIRLPWAQLTHLDAQFHFDNECLEIMNMAPHLVDCKLCVLASMGNLLPVVVHPHLRHLSLFAADSTIRVRLWKVLDKMTLPALRTLRLNAKRFPLDSLKEFVSRSHCILEELAISQPSQPLVTYREALPSVGTVTLLK
jgi:hypothetical protein